MEKERENEVEKVKLLQVYLASKVHVYWWSADPAVLATACQQMEFIFDPSFV